MNKKGFTLIELLVVIGIIGLLSTLAVVALGSARQKARDSKRLSDIKQVQTALELYFTDNNTYPVANNITLGVDATCLVGTGFASGTACTSATSTYMGLIPRDPQSPSQDYMYHNATATGAYVLNTTLEGAVNDLGPGTVTATPDGIQ